MTREEFEKFLNYLRVQDKQGNIIPINKEQMLRQYDRIANFIKKENVRRSKRNVRVVAVHKKQISQSQ